MKLYVGKLNKEITKEDLKEAFAPFGQLGEVLVIIDKFTNTSKGFGFVEMPNKEEAEAAIAGMHGKPLKGQNIDVNEARPKTENSSRGGYGGGHRGGNHR